MLRACMLSIPKSLLYHQGSWQFFCSAMSNNLISFHRHHWKFVICPAHFLGESEGLALFKEIKTIGISWRRKYYIGLSLQN